jgi:endonuclease/exonuclease/phosphatase family metal-dependent hydrolase
MVVATFNIRNGRAFDGTNSWWLRRRSTAAMIGMLDADVLGLQEAYAFQLRYLAARLDGHHVAGSGRRGSTAGEHCSVVTRDARLRLMTHETKWFGDDPTRPSRLAGARFERIATIATYQDRESRRLTVINTHLDERSPHRRAASARQLATWTPRDEPAIVMGDLNTADEAEVFDPLTRAGLRSVLGPDAPGTNHDSRGHVTGARLDHILVTAHFDVVDARVVSTATRRLPSDHWPVRAELQWNTHSA